MGASPASTSIQRLPLVLAATFAVVGAPVVAISLLRASDAVTSFLTLAVVGTALSVAASSLGARAWARWAAAGDTVFGDLMIWGWLMRRRQERQLASAVKLLGLRESGRGSAAQLSASRRVRLLEQLAAALEARHPDTSGHSRRVARHAVAIAKRMGLPPEEVARVRTAAAVHDVGKIEIPVGIVDKPEALNEGELAAIRRHASAGATMVAGLGDGELTAIVRHHHERFDGRGYPDGLAGTSIPLGARIVAVADTFDAVTSTRSYRQARRHREALALLGAEAGAQFDPDVVDAFRGYYSGIRPVAAWATFLNGSRQLAASLAGEAKLGGVVAAATLTSVAAGGAWVPPLEVGQSAPPARASGEIAGHLAGPAGDGTAAPPARPVARRDSAAGEPGVLATSVDAGSDGVPVPSEPGEGAGPGGSESQPASGSDPAEGGDPAGGSSPGGGAGGGQPSGAQRASDGLDADRVASEIRSSVDRVASKPVVSDVAEPVSPAVESVVEAVESTRPEVPDPSGSVDAEPDRTDPLSLDAGRE